MIYLFKFEMQNYKYLIESPDLGTDIKIISHNPKNSTDFIRLNKAWLDIFCRKHDIAAPRYIEEIILKPVAKFSLPNWMY